MEEAKAKQAGRLAKLGGLEESLSTQDTITDAPAQSAVDILVRARSAEAAGDKKKERRSHQVQQKHSTAAWQLSAASAAAVGIPPASSR